MTSAENTRPTGNGLPAAVIVAALAAGVGLIPALLGFTGHVYPVGAMYSVGWLGFGLAAPLLLDQDPRSRVGRVFTALSLTPLVVGGLALTGPGSGWEAVSRTWVALGWLVVAIALVAVAWVVDLSADRMSRRRLAWLVVWSAALFAPLMGSRMLADDSQAAVVTMLGLWAFAAAGTRLVLSRQFRPLDEPLLDLAAVVGPVVVGGTAGLLARWVAGTLYLPGTDLSAAFVAIVSATLAWPLFRWLRNSCLERRYGRGVLSPDDVAVITAGLHAQTDPRELLGQAAAMVSAASGHQDVSIVLGPDEPDEPDDAGETVGGLTHHRLVVGGDRVGTLSVRSRLREGPEPRQVYVVTQLLPTVALVARAVGLAVEADHARQDVARERDAERARILGDLHDGVGPVLAGMSMRVQAQLRTAPTPLLEALAAELADCRGDLRRIVSGLTPSALHGGDLADALRALVDSFAGADRTIRLHARLEQPLSPEVAVAVYRSVAEGITNAIRHGAAAEVGVSVHSDPAGRVRVEVSDSGRGGTVVPGVGLTSLRRRAEQLGGRLQVEAAHPNGVRLRVELPASGVAA